MHEALSIPLAGLPFLLTACAAAVAALMWLPGPAGSLKRSIIRFSIVLGVWALISVALLAQSSAMGASSWYRWWVSGTFLMEVGAVEAVGAVLNARLPHRYWLAYVAGVVFVAAAAVWHPAVSRVPDGWWIGLHGAGGWVLPMVLLLGLAAAVWVVFFLTDAFSAVFAVGVVAATAMDVDCVMGARGAVVPLAPTWLIGLGILAAAWIGLWRLSTSTQVPGDPDVLSPALGVAYGERVLTQRALGVLWVGLEPFAELSAAWGRETAQEVWSRVGGELRQICRQNDRVMSWDRGGFIMLFPDIPVHHERHVRDRAREAIRLLRVQVGDVVVPLGDSVSCGWAWGEPGAMFVDVVDQAERSMREEQWRTRRLPQPEAAD